MTYRFETKQLAQVKLIPKSVVIILQNSAVANKAAYNRLIKTLATDLSKIKLSQTQSALFQQEIQAIQENKPLTEKTPWGGVSLKEVDVAKNHIKKLLVIKPLGALGFEIHKKKLEKLQVLEGVCLIFFAGNKKGMINVQLAASGDRFVLEPGDEHGILTLSPTIIEEVSTNHLDDLIYIFQAKQLINS